MGRFGEGTLLGSEHVENHLRGTENDRADEHPDESEHGEAAEDTDDHDSGVEFPAVADYRGTKVVVRDANQNAVAEE